MEGKNLIRGTCRDVNEFEKINRIGEGTYGTVYCALDRTNNQLVALKRIILHNEETDGFPTTSLREISCLYRCNTDTHPNVVQLYDVVVGKKRDQVFLVFEYCEHDLAALIKHFQEQQQSQKLRDVRQRSVNSSSSSNLERLSPFSVSEIKTLIKQLLSAIRHLHDHWIVHRDIKLSNLLYNYRGQLKVADFGLARSCSSRATDMTQKVVTLWYRAPELLLGSTCYSFPIDLWSVGCTAGELLLGRPILPGDDEKDQLHRIFSLLGSPTTRIWPDIDTLPAIKEQTIDLSKIQQKHQYNNLNLLLATVCEDGIGLLNHLLAYDPRRRISARDSLRHPYFDVKPYPKEEDLMPTFPTLHDKVAHYL